MKKTLMKRISTALLSITLLTSSIPSLCNETISSSFTPKTSSFNLKGIFEQSCKKGILGAQYSLFFLFFLALLRYRLKGQENFQCINNSMLGNICAFIDSLIGTKPIEYKLTQKFGEATVTTMEVKPGTGLLGTLHNYMPALNIVTFIAACELLNKCGLTESNKKDQKLALNNKAFVDSFNVAFNN